MARWQDIVMMDIVEFQNLNKPQLRAVTQKLIDVANKRLKNIEKAGISTPASRYVETSGGKFTTRGKDVNQLKSEFMRVKNFLESPTSSKSGYDKVKQKTADTLKSRGIEISPDKLDNVFKIYERLKERNPEIMAQQLKYSTLAEISNAIDDSFDYEEVLIRMQEELTNIYEKEQEILTGGGGGISEFFEI